MENNRLYAVRDTDTGKLVSDITNPKGRMKCAYCDSDNNDFVQLNQTFGYSGIEMALNRQGMLRVRYYMHNGIDRFESQDIIQIKHCPYCGAKMDGERRV